MSAYLDYNATNPLLPAALAAVADALREPGNASSLHRHGRRARMLIERAREDVAALAGAHPNQVTFTSGATEANNAVLKYFTGKRVLVSAIEHPSILESAPQAERIPVTAAGIVDLNAFERILTQGTVPALISIMMVNNETGVIQPVADIAKRARTINRDVFIHTDAVQAAGKVKIDMPALYVDYMSLSAHKIGGPQGVGALISAPGVPPVRFLHGGGQEKTMRAGTENVAAIAGFGAAATHAHEGLEAYQKISALRDKIEDHIKKTCPAAAIFGAAVPRVVNTINVALPGIPAGTLLMAFDLEKVSLSSGSACSSGTVRPSHVLKAMTVPDDLSACAIRISMGWATTEQEIDSFLAAWDKITARLRDKIEAASCA